MLKRRIGWVYVLDSEKYEVSDREYKTIFGRTSEELNKKEEEFLGGLREEHEIDDIVWSDDVEAVWDECLGEWQ